MQHVITKTKSPVKMWIKIENVESAAIDQLINIANLPFIYKHIAVMPDVHLGRGATVGSVIPTTNAIIPAAVGVDIGCGMVAVKLPVKAEDLKKADLKQIRSMIEREVPLGFNSNETINTSSGKRGSALGELKANIDVKVKERSLHQIGTLGGGNHFIELCEDTEEGTWAMIHTGSRNIGNVVAKHYIKVAKDLMVANKVSLPDRDLAYLSTGTKEFDDYWHDLKWCQKFAEANRAEILDRVLGVVIRYFGYITSPTFLRRNAIECSHNYTTLEIHQGNRVYVTRKGAIKLRKDDYGIIPGSMGAKSFIVKGLGNIETFDSCSHGAGRKMSRTAAKKAFTVDDLKEQTKGVECKKGKSVLDEIPGAYKDIDEVIELQSDLLVPMHQLKQLICIKG